MLVALVDIGGLVFNGLVPACSSILVIVMHVIGQEFVL